MRSRQIRWTIVAAVASLSTANPSLAQTSDGQALLPARPIPLVEQILVHPVWPPQADPFQLAQRMAVAQRWAFEYTDWKEWEARWQGRPEPGLFRPKERRRKPDPPDWLSAECRDVVHAEGTLADACQLLAEWREDYSAAQVRARILAGRAEQETFTKWWNHIHLDALWLTPNVPASYGLIGVHATLKVVGRWQVFVAPGAIFLNVPTSARTRAWVPATDLGVSYRLFDLRLPGSQRQGTVHLNLARAWILGQSGSIVASTVDLAGFSLTLK
jgi:hypothetical protein